MLNSLWVIVPVSVLLGFLSGLGTGGGSLLILWLTLVLGVSHSDAKAINLMFFIPAAIIACFFRWKQGHINIPKVLPGILAGCASAGICTLLTAGQTPEILQKAFGFLLIGTGIREVLYKNRSR